MSPHHFVACIAMYDTRSAVPHISLSFKRCKLGVLFLRVCVFAVSVCDCKAVECLKVQGCLLASTRPSPL